MIILIKDLLIIVLRTFIVFFLLHFMMKKMGKREIGQLNLFDAIILMSIANICILAIENYDINILYSIIPVILITITQKVLAHISLKKSKVRALIDGNKTFIIVKGQIVYDNMEQEKYNVGDLLLQLREKGIRKIEEVEYAVLDTNGKLNIYKYDNDNNFPFPIIVSGEYCFDNIHVLGVSIKRIEKLLNQKNKKLKDVLLCYYVDNDLYFPSTIFFSNIPKSK